MDVVSAHLGSSFLFVWAFSFLKRWDKFPWVSEATRKLNTAISTAVALFVALGIHFDHSGYTVLDGGHVMIAIPGAYALMQAASHFATQRGLQYGMYHGMNMARLFAEVTPEQISAVVNAIQKSTEEKSS
jgi:hypothetical protein